MQTKQQTLSYMFGTGNEILPTQKDPGCTIVIHVVETPSLTCPSHPFVSGEIFGHGTARWKCSATMQAEEVYILTQSALASSAQFHSGG